MSLPNRFTVAATSCPRARGLDGPGRGQAPRLGRRGQGGRPLIDEETVGVVRADLARWTSKRPPRPGRAGARRQGGHRPGLGARPGVAGGVPPGGGREVLRLASLADVGFQREPLPLVAVPLRSKADPRRWPPLSPAPGDEAPSRRNPLGRSPVDAERLESLKPDERPELAAAFEAAGGSAVEALLLPPSTAAA